MSEERAAQLVLAVVENLSECLFACRLDGTILFANPQAAVCAGIARDELIGRIAPFRSALPPHEDSLWPTIAAETLAHQRWCGDSILFASGEKKLVELTTFLCPSAYGREPVIGLLSRMISLERSRHTSRRDLEEHLSRRTDELEQVHTRLQEESAERLAVEETLQELLCHQAAILANIPDMAWLKDRECRFIAVNEPFARFAGKSLDKIIGKNDFDICPLDLAEHYRADDLEVMRTGKSKRVVEPHPFLRDDGGIIWIETVKSPVFDKDGRCVGTAGIARDITERRRLEEKLRQNERLASIGTLAAGIAHEINNPLGISLLAVEQAQALLEDQNGDSTAAKERLLEIETAIRRCARIVTSVLQFSREQESEKWPIDLLQLVRQSVQKVERQSITPGIRFSVEAVQDLPKALANPIEIEQVLLNILVNAAHASPSDQTVSIQLASEPDMVTISVTDQGAGIQCADLGRIFDPFYTTRHGQGSSGLGLSIVHGIVSKHGGTVSVQSKPNAGTTFSIKLPRVDGLQ